MDQNEDFNQHLFSALEERAQWISSSVLPKLDESYHLHLTCIKNLFEVLEKKSLIKPDPYKHDKKISDIVPPESTEFNEGEKAAVLGSRLSDYEAMIDFVCNYVKFSPDMTLDRINKLLNLNKAFLWNSLTPNSPKPNTRGLATVLNQACSGAPQLTLSLISENRSLAAKTSGDIDMQLKTLGMYKRESYKAEVRKNVLQSAQFSTDKAYQSATVFTAEVKKLFPSLMQKRPFSNELVGELAQEETAGDRDARRQKLLDSLKVPADTKKRKKATVDTKALIMDAARSLGGLGEQYEKVLPKIQENHDVLEGEKNSLFDRLKKLLRKAFNLADPAVDYDIQVTDPATNAKKKETIHYNQFVTELTKRAKYYTGLGTRNSAAYNTMSAQEEQVILDFISKQITDNSRVITLLAGLDDFFKNSGGKAGKSKIKGIKMELSILKNVLQRVAQQRAEYTAFVEERAQMKKLGIETDD